MRIPYEKVKGRLEGRLKDLSGPAVSKTLGQILIEKNIISQAQLDLALRKQKQEPGAYLGQILFEIGVPQEKINQALNYFNKRRSIGRILLDLKLITARELEGALEKQKELRRKGVRKLLGTLLSERNAFAAQDYLKALSGHFNMPVISLESLIPSPALQRVIGEKYALHHRILVLEESSQILKLALAEPSLLLMEEIERAVSPGKQVEFYLASPAELEVCLKKQFDPFAVTRYR